MELKGYTSVTTKICPIAFNEMEGIENWVSTVQSNMVSSESPRNKSGGDNPRKRRAKHSDNSSVSDEDFQPTIFWPKMTYDIQQLIYSTG